MFVSLCSPTLQNLIFERTGGCVRISTTAESLFWRVEVQSLIVLSNIAIQFFFFGNSKNFLWIFWSLQRLFFLNGEQDLSSFLLADLGIIKYPTYNCIITEPIFSDRNDLLAYEEVVLVE